MKKAYGDPRLFAVNRLAEQLRRSRQPLVPERVVVLGSGENGASGADAAGLLGKLLALLVAERAGAGPAADVADLEARARELIRQLPETPVNGATEP